MIMQSVIIINSIVGFCIFAIFLAILFNFMDYSQYKNKVKKEKSSIVETGSMTIFFILIYLFLRFKIGSFEYTTIYQVVIGLILMVFGTWFNIWGRHYLGKNWANQIKIYKNHNLVTTGPYKIVRHPLYASIIWMFYASSIVYSNYLVFILTTIVFIPFMFYRAKQEEKLLKVNFEDYNQYTKEVGMFFPNLIKINKK